MINSSLFRDKRFDEQGKRIFSSGVHCDYMAQQSYDGFSAICANELGGAVMKFSETLKLCSLLKNDALAEVNLFDLNPFELNVIK